MSYKYFLICDECGKTEELKGNVPPGWREVTTKKASLPWNMPSYSTDWRTFIACSFECAGKNLLKAVE